MEDYNNAYAVCLTQPQLTLVPPAPAPPPTPPSPPPSSLPLRLLLGRRCSAPVQMINTCKAGVLFDWFLLGNEESSRVETRREYYSFLVCVAVRSCRSRYAYVALSLSFCISHWTEYFIHEECYCYFIFGLLIIN